MPIPLTPLLLHRLWSITKAVLMLSALTLAGTWCLRSTLDDMTRRDCQQGTAAACKQVGDPLPRLIRY